MARSTSDIPEIPPNPNIYSLSNLYVGVVASFFDCAVNDGSVYQTPDSSLAASEGFGDDFEV